VTGYGSWHAPFGVRLSAALGQARTTLDLQRTVTDDTVVVQGQRRATQRFGALIGSTRVPLHDWQLSPRVGVRRTTASIGGATESDTSPLALAYDSARLTSTDWHGGVALSRPWSLALWRFEPEASLEWHRRLQGGLTQTVRYADDLAGASYAVTSIEPASQYAQLGLALRLRHPLGVTFGLGARSLLGAHALRSTAYSASALWPF